MAEEKKDHLIFSKKRTKGWDYAMWYRPNRCGYTFNLNEAGRYTKTEAALIQSLAPENVIAVSEETIESFNPHSVVSVESTELQKLLNQPPPKQ